MKKTIIKGPSSSSSSSSSSSPYASSSSSSSSSSSDLPSKPSRRGILKNMAVSCDGENRLSKENLVSEEIRLTEEKRVSEDEKRVTEEKRISDENRVSEGKRLSVDLSGRHLERLPSYLFSSLHLTSLNLSHNLLSGEHKGHHRKRRSRCRRRELRRRQGLSDIRKTSGPSFQETQNSEAQNTLDENFSGDSGFKSEHIDLETIELEREKEGTVLDFEKEGTVLDFEKEATVLDFEKEATVLDFEKEATVLDFEKEGTVLDFEGEKNRSKEIILDRRKTQTIKAGDLKEISRNIKDIIRGINEGDIGEISRENLAGNIEEKKAGNLKDRGTNLNEGEIEISEEKKAGNIEEKKAGILKDRSTNLNEGETGISEEKKAGILKGAGVCEENLAGISKLRDGNEDREIINGDSRKFGEREIGDGENQNKESIISKTQIIKPKWDCLADELQAKLKAKKIQAQNDELRSENVEKDKLQTKSKDKISEIVQNRSPPQPPPPPPIANLNLRAPSQKIATPRHRAPPPPIANLNQRVPPIATPRHCAPQPPSPPIASPNQHTPPIATLNQHTPPIAPLPPPIATLNQCVPPIATLHQPSPPIVTLNQHTPPIVPPPLPISTTHHPLPPIATLQLSPPIATVNQHSQLIAPPSSCSEGDSERDSDSCCGVDDSDSDVGGATNCATRILGALNHLKHFQQLQVLVLSRNRLKEFPGCLLSLPRLVCLSLAHNSITTLPNAIYNSRLVEFDISYNVICGDVHIPSSLTHIRASYNKLTYPPSIHPMATLNAIDLSGNRLQRVGDFGKRTMGVGGEHDHGGRKMREVNRDSDDDDDDDVESHPLILNLRLNDLTGPVTLASIQNVTELDVSDNGISSLDVSSLSCLNSLKCSNNELTSINLHGATLTSLTANNNKLTNLDVRYHPRRLTTLNLAKNELCSVPSWLVSSTEINYVDISNNNVNVLPAFITSGHLTRLHTLSLHHNLLNTFPVPNNTSHIQHHHTTKQRPLCSLEVLLLHANRLNDLPSNLFTWLNRLRVLNVSSNQLSILPGLVDSNRDRNGQEFGLHSAQPTVTLSLQELYAAGNKLRDLSSLQHCRALRILHAPYNQINTLNDRLVWSWELLEELVLSGNRLGCVPTGVSRLRRLRVLRVHTNPLTSLPRLAHLSSLRVVDASHCQLGRVELEELVSPGLLALDVSGNTALSLDHHQFTKCRSRRPVNVVDVTSRSGRSLPLTRPQAIKNHTTTNSSPTDSTSNLPWSLGFAEAVGRDSKLTVGQLRMPDVGSMGSVGVGAVADGGIDGHNGSVGNLLSSLPTLLQEELTCSHTPHTYALKYALLTALRQLRSQGCTVPKAVCAAHLEAGKGIRYPVLRLCCYGHITVTVTTTTGNPIVITTPPITIKPKDNIECIEGNKCILSDPTTLPDPHTTELHLGPNHTAVVIANSSLWDEIDSKEVARICNQNRVPGSAAKHLLDLALAYGVRQSVSVIVIQLDRYKTERYKVDRYMSDRYTDAQDERRVTFEDSDSDRPSLDGKNGGKKSGVNFKPLYIGSNKSGTNYRSQDKSGANYRSRDKSGANFKPPYADTDLIYGSHDKNGGNFKSPYRSHDKKGGNFKSSYTDTDFIYGSHDKSGGNFKPPYADTDRSSPSGQSQSDYSELYQYNVEKVTFQNSNVKSWKSIEEVDLVSSNSNTQNSKPWKSIEDLYSYPVRKSKDARKIMKVESKLQKSSNTKLEFNLPKNKLNQSDSFVLRNTNKSTESFVLRNTKPGDSIVLRNTKPSDSIVLRNTNKSTESFVLRNTKPSDSIVLRNTNKTTESFVLRNTKPGDSIVLKNTKSDSILQRNSNIQKSDSLVDLLRNPKVDSKVQKNGKNIKNSIPVTYYHYPRPDPLAVPSDHHLDHLTGYTQGGGVLAPPEGFGDPGSDSEGSDSGLSGVSAGLNNTNIHSTSTNQHDEQVTDEQFRSWEYLLARNAKLLFMRELDTLQRPNSHRIMPTVSAPDLVLATEAEPSGHFQRNVVRKSRLGRGTFRMIQTKLSATTSKFSTLQKLRRSNSKTSNFRRFGSLQNLKYYQENRPRPSYYNVVEPDLSLEMQEKNSLDSLELETRMHHYWHTGVTNF